MNLPPERPESWNCRLCNSKGVSFFDSRSKRYYRCLNCLSVFLNPKDYLSQEEEKKRYLEHNNDVEDSGYQAFVRPLVSAVCRFFKPESCGLDFGAGTGPVAAKLLSKAGYQVELYDPFFWNNPCLLKKNYDYIVCSEVIEHFKNPADEFKLLKSLLKPNGRLFCFTDLYSDEVDFSSWYYKNDPTHVFFYHEKAFDWIKSAYGFTACQRQGRLINLANS